MLSQIIKMSSTKDCPLPAIGQKLNENNSSCLNQTTCNEMIISALKALKQTTGSSQEAITKYVEENYDVPEDDVRQIARSLKAMVGTELVRVKIAGAVRYKLNTGAAAPETHGKRKKFTSTQSAKRKHNKRTRGKSIRKSRKAGRRKKPARKSANKRRWGKRQACGANKISQWPRWLVSVLRRIV